MKRMLFRKTTKKRGRKTKKKEFFSFFNFPIILLTIISIFFICSFIYEIGYNNRNGVKNINLKELLQKQSNAYEKKTDHRIALEVLNGCGQGKIAAMYQKFLRNEGFDVMDAKNALTSAGSYDHNHEYSKIQIHRGDIEMAYCLS